MLMRFACLSLTPLAAFAASAPPSPSIGNAAATDSAGAAASKTLDNLVVTLGAVGASPPTVRVTVTNKNRRPVTILSYQSPLDELALALGLLAITPAGAAKPLDLPVVRAKRVWPPRPESLIVVKPGASATNDIVLGDPTVPMEKLGSGATVVLSGRWMAVWPKSRDELSDSDIENSSETALSGGFTSNALQIRAG